jgi:hypothetical protein
MTLRRFTSLALAAAALAFAVPVRAGNTLIPAGQRVAVAASALTVQPDTEWNRLAARPGRYAERWTLDGDQLDALTFYGGIPDGKTLVREVDRKDRPLPRVAATMLITDIPTLLENSYRVAFGVAAMTIDRVEPARFAGSNGVHFTYSYVRPSESLHRRGEAFGAIIGGRLYLITYEAPALHYYERSLLAARHVAESARV